jgi:hypothetical protein
MYPTIAAVIGVRDENELIRRCVEHLEAQHVRAIVVVDNGSVDGTRAILRDLQAEKRIALIETEGNAQRDADYFRRGIALAKELFAPDWILIQDADEFWIHRSGDLRQAFVAPLGDALIIDRFNACLCARLMAFGKGLIKSPADLDVFTAPLLLSRTVMDDDATLRWIAAQPAGKVAARAAVIATVSLGGHSAFAQDGSELPMQPLADLMIVHVPFLSFTRFQRKVANAKALLTGADNIFPGSTAWHWKRWIDLLDESGLEREFAHQILSAGDLDRLSREGSVQQASRYLSARMPEVHDGRAPCLRIPNGDDAANRQTTTA